MKISNIVKYIFVVFVIVLISFAVYKIYKSNNKKNTSNTETTNQAEENIIKDIRLGISSYDTMNPLITNNKEILKIDTLIFEPLFTISDDYELNTCLATEWSKTGTNTYVIKLNTTVKWQDNAYFTAKDVQFTIDRLKESNSVYKSNVEHVISVEVVDASTVRITLDTDVPFFEYNLTFPIMSNLYYFNEDFFNSAKIPIGTGRFQITNISNNSITLSKNKNWRKISEDESKIDTIKINLYSSMGEVFNSFKLGNIDLINTTNFGYQDYIGTIGFKTKDVPGREFDFISLNCQDGLLQDKYVRQALALAIDKNAINSAVYGNQKLVANYPIDYGNYLYSVDTNSSGYNPDQSKKILTDNGWEYSNNRWKKRNDDYSTSVLNLKLYVCQDSEARVNVANNVKEQLEAIGINVSVIKISRDTYNQYLINKDYQMLITGIYNSYSPDLTYFFGQNNISNYSNDELVNLLNSGISTKDKSGIIENYKKIYNIYKEDVPFIGLYRNKSILITNQSLQGNIVSNTYNEYYNISSWYRK